MNGGTTPVGVHYHACYERHDPGATHPESPARYRALRAALEELPPEIVRLPGRARAGAGSCATPISNA